MALGEKIGYKLTEEIVRWRFELALHESAEWWIAFTNPTAGPWKRLMGRDARGEAGEVYRFPRDDDRPDVVAVDDRRKIVLIVEAKDAPQKLLIADQVAKSSSVVLDLAKALKELPDNPFWRGRGGYQVVAGLLWGLPTGVAAPSVTALFAAYASPLKGIPLVGFQSTQAANGTLTCDEFPGPGLKPGVAILRG